jgi:hypothetical protein
MTEKEKSCYNCALQHFGFIMEDGGRSKLFCVRGLTEEEIMHKLKSHSCPRLTKFWRDEIRAQTVDEELRQILDRDLEANQK